MADRKHNPSSARPIRLGIVGCGEVTRAKHLPAIRAAKGVAVAVAADLDQTRCREIAARFAIPRTCSTIEELLQTPDLDAVAVCTPPTTHADLAIAAVRAGKHVWVDKPLALSEEECVRMIDEAARAQTVTMTGLHMRFHRLVVKARAAIRRGELGRIESVRVVWHSPRSDLSIPAWKTLRASGGGALVEIAPHHLDLLRFLLNSEIAEIFAISNDDVRQDENAVISARMSNGVVVSGEFSERSPHEMQIVIAGSAGILTVDCLRFEGFQIRSIRQVPGAPGYRARAGWNFLCGLPAGLDIMRRGGDYRISYFNAWSAFFDAIRGSRVPLPSFADGLRATQAVCAALSSREQRTLVTIPPPRTAAHGPITNDNPAAPSESGQTVFSVVIPTFNRRAQIKQLLDKLALQRFPSSDFEVIVVDDGGSEPLESIIAPLRGRLQIRLLRQANGGCAAARQVGIEAAKGRFLAFTDDDCLPGLEWLASLHAALLRDPASAVVGPTLNELQKNLRSETTQLIVNWLIRTDADPQGWVCYGPTCNLAFPAEQFASVGGLDKSWRIAGGEDRDLCARWLEAGLGMHFEPQAQVMHHHSLTMGQFVRQHFNYGRGARKYRRRLLSDDSRYRSHGNLVDYCRLMLLPWKNYDGLVAATIAMYLGLAQAATAAGVFVEMSGLLRRRPTSSDLPHALPAPRRSQVSGRLAARDFDYIIIGGGAAGCALAARLSERSDLSVLLIEAGGSYPRILSVPLVGMRTKMTFSWKYFTSQQTSLSQRRISFPFGKVLGGSSSINAMMYVRGSPAAYDRWAELGNPGWSFADVLPYFRKSERFEDGASEFHGDCGPIHVSRPRHRAPFSQAFVEACVESGMAATDDFNGPAPEGAGFFHVMQHRGRRSGAATSYLALARSRPNLRVQLRTTVQRIIVENHCAVGVEFIDERKKVVRKIARGEVLLSAGALNSPKVLMLSGIGPASELQRLGIKCLLDLPGVGANLQDHVRVPVLYQTNRRSPGAMINWPRALLQYAMSGSGVLASNCCESGALVRTDPSQPLPDLQFVTHFQSHLYPGVVDLQFCLVRTQSRGRITLNSADPTAAPLIDPNYLSDPADVRAAITGVRRARQIAGTSTLRRFPLGMEILPGCDLQSDSQLENYCRSFGETCYHPSSTCRMGADAMSVIDTNLRVHCVDRLRIVDASVMPELPNGNTCAPTYMIAEKAAELILARD